MGPSTSRFLFGKSLQVGWGSQLAQDTDVTVDAWFNRGTRRGEETQRRRPISSWRLGGGVFCEKIRELWLLLFW